MTSFEEEHRREMQQQKGRRFSRNNEKDYSTHGSAQFSSKAYNNKRKTEVGPEKWISRNKKTNVRLRITIASRSLNER